MEPGRVTQQRLVLKNKAKQTNPATNEQSNKQGESWIFLLNGKAHDS